MNLRAARPRAWAVVLCAVIGACGRSGGGGSAAGVYDPCAGKACGAACKLCDPKDRSCIETAVLKYCGAEGQCAAPFPSCPAPDACHADADCPVVALCAVCPDGSASCPEGRCIGGHCITRFPECRSECQAREDCPALGMPCQTCSDGSIACPTEDCIGGHCVVSYPHCDGYVPCQDKACGASCTVCDPKDPGCSETAVLKFCDARGECTPASPDCNLPSCRVDADCPAVGVCPTCPGDQCAALACVDGHCAFTCPPGSPPECTTTEDCPQLGMPCIPCPDGWNACPSVECTAGKCVAQVPTCDGHDPCAGRACGDPCDACGGLCASPVASYCDAALKCTIGVPVCGGDRCQLPADPGPCDAYMPRFYFDTKTGKCTSFVFGGCQGNDNNFLTAAACVSACAQSAAPACDAIICPSGEQCAYVRVSEPDCVAPCGDGGACPPGKTCGCAASCPGCKNCLNACIPG